MRPAPIEVAYALYGAWRLAHFDRSGLVHLRRDAEGFWNSFFAAVVVAPPYAALMLLHLSQVEVTADLASVVLIHGLGYVISWVAFPLVTYHICEAMGREREWIAFVVALNWSKVIQIAVYLPAVAISASGLLGAAGGGLLTFAVSLAVLAYQWFVTRCTLDSTGGAAAGLVGLDLVLGLAITGFADGAVS